MRISWQILALIISVNIFLWPMSAIACGAPQSRIFLDKPVTVLPYRAVQLQVQVEDNVQKNDQDNFASTKATVINILRGDVPDTQVIIQLKTPLSSCHIIGERGPDKYVVGYFIRDEDGKLILTQDGLIILEPILYSPRRNIDDEQRIAEHFRDKY